MGFHTLESYVSTAGLEQVYWSYQLYPPLWSIYLSFNILSQRSQARKLFLKSGKSQSMLQGSVSSLTLCNGAWSSIQVLRNIYFEFTSEFQLNIQFSSAFKLKWINKDLSELHLRVYLRG